MMYYAQRIADMNVADQVNTLIANATAELAKNLEARLKAQEDLSITLQAQMAELKVSIATPIDIAQLDLNTNDIIYLKTLLGITDDSKPGDISILGKFTSETSETGALYIKVSDEDAATIGKGVIKEGELKTKIATMAVNADSRIFVTIRKADKAVPIKTGIVKNGESFEVEINDISTGDVEFDWWIIMSH